MKVNSSLTPLASLASLASLTPLAPFRAILLSLALTLTLPAHAESTLQTIKNRIFGKQADQYTVIESGYWVAENVSVGQMAWLDENRLLFRGGKISEFKVGQRTYALYIWDTGPNTVTKYADQLVESMFCYSQGYVIYRTADTPSIFKAGPFGREQAISVQIDTQKPNSQLSTFRSWLTCKDHPYFTDEMREKYNLPKMYIPLLEGHGILDVVGLHGDDRSPARWFPSNGASPVTLPIPRHTIYQSHVYYSEWANAYVLHSNYAPPEYHHTSGVWPKGIDQPIWLLKLDGTLERREIPYVKWNRGIRKVYVSRAGVLLANDDPTPDMGLYLQQGREWVRILEGGPSPVAVAPDGCKVAAYVGGLEFLAYGLKLIDVCKKKGK